MSEEQGESQLERRSFERLDLELEVLWKRLKPDQAETLSQRMLDGDNRDYAQQAAALGDSVHGRALTLNLSKQGFRLADGSELEMGWELLVGILMPETAKSIPAVATVIWITPKGLGPCQAGLVFKAMSPEVSEHFSAFLAMAGGV
jgi:hypothetical protein